MLQKLICINFVIHIFTLFCNAVPVSEFNETKLLLSLNSQLSELRAEQQQQKQDLISKSIDLRFLKEDIQFAKADIHSLRAELERQRTDKESDLESLRAELRLQRNLIDGCVNRSYAHGCTGVQSNGVYSLFLPNFSREPFEVACDAHTQGGGWTVILKRIDGSVDFYRNWSSYKNGFGDLNGEFFLGLDKIHAMTAESKQEILFVLEDFEGDERFELYDEFAIGREDEQYVLHTLGKGSGSAGDAMSYYLGVKFTTFDRDNDNWAAGNCAIDTHGAFWYKNHRDSQLTGTYNDNTEANGLKWYPFRGSKYSLKKAVMMIRPRK